MRSYTALLAYLLSHCVRKSWAYGHALRPAKSCLASCKSAASNPSVNQLTDYAFDIVCDMTLRYKAMEHRIGLLGTVESLCRRARKRFTDTEEPVGPDNPLRQVIVNTHSPAVVMQVPDDSLLITELRETIQGDRRFNPDYS
jgi:hypothetical protein